MPTPERERHRRSEHNTTSPETETRLNFQDVPVVPDSYDLNGLSFDLSLDQTRPFLHRLPKTTATAVVISLLIRRAVNLLRQGQISRRDFLRLAAGSLAAGSLAAVAGSCGPSESAVSPAVGEVPTRGVPGIENKQWAQMSTPEKITWLELGGALTQTGKEPPDYAARLAEYVTICSQYTHPGFAPDIIHYVDTANYLAEYRRNSLNGDETVEELQRAHSGAFVSKDNEIYVWYDDPSPLFTDFKPLRTDPVKNPSRLDTFALAVRLTVSHEYTHTLSAHLIKGQFTPMYIETPDGLMEVEDIFGFALQGHLINLKTGEIDPNRPYRFTAVEEAAAELLNQRLTLQAGLGYKDVTRYHQGVAFLQQVLDRAGITAAELGSIKQTGGFPDLLNRLNAAVSKASGVENNLDTVGAILTLIIQTTMRQKTSDEAANELNKLFPLPSPE